MFKMKGQGTTEYLIILAVIIVVALVVAGVMGWFPGAATAITEQQSKAYWQSTSPLAVTGWDISSANTDLVLRNQTTDRIEVTEVALSGTAVGITDANIVAGSQATFGGTGVTCTTGQAYQYNVVITYNVENGLQGAKLTGQKPLVGTCS
ncbi:MAG TPA: hypothetical protein VFF09_02030 [archaeon]|nr:hypothetical protein [archaeon]